MHPRERIASIVSSAIAQHEAAGNAAPDPSAVAGIQEWAGSNQDRIERAIAAGWSESQFTQRLATVLHHAQSQAGVDPVQRAHVVSALDDPISNGCNC